MMKNTTIRHLGLGLALCLGLSIQGFAQAADPSDLFAASADASAATADGPATATSAATATDQSTAASTQTAGGFELQLSGTHGADYRLPVYPDAFNYQGALKLPDFSNLLGLRVKAGEVKLVSEWDVKLEGAATAGGQPNLTAQAGENALYWNPQYFKFGLGWQYFAWGTADKQNPTDHLNARDYTVGLDAAKIPALALSATWYPAGFMSLQAVVKPLMEASLFPLDFPASTQTGVDTIYDNLRGAMYSTAYQSGVASVRQNLYNANFAVTHNVAMANAYADANLAAAVATNQATIVTNANAFVAANLAKATVNVSEPATDPYAIVAGARAAFTLGGVDLSLSYLYDWDSFFTPVLTLNDGDYKYLKSVSLQKQRIHRFGADFKTTLDKLGLWAEAAYNMSGDWQMTDYGVRNPSLAWTIGADLSFGPSDAIYLNLQYLGEWVPLYDHSFGSDYNAATMTSDNLKDANYMLAFYQRSMVQRLGGQTEGLNQGASLNLKATVVPDSLACSLTVVGLMPFLYDDSSTVRLGSLVLKPELDFAPADSFHIKLGANLAWSWIQPTGQDIQLATANDRIGQYTTGNNVYLALDYSWTYQLKK